MKTCVEAMSKNFAYDRISLLQTFLLCFVKCYTQVANNEVQTA